MAHEMRPIEQVDFFSALAIETSWAIGGGGGVFASISGPFSVSSLVQKLYRFNFLYMSLLQN